MSELPIPRTEAELVATVLGHGGSVELLNAAVRLSGLPFWRRRQLSAADLSRDYALRAPIARKLIALWELAERWFPDERPSVHSTRDALLLLDHLRAAQREHVEAILLDARHRLIAVETICIGSVNASHLLARDVFAPALRRSAVAIVLGHNHPSGDPAPSASDNAVTRALRDAGVLLGIPVLDHIIVGRHSHHSFRDAERWDRVAQAA